MSGDNNHPDYKQELTRLTYTKDYITSILSIATLLYVAITRAMHTLDFIGTDLTHFRKKSPSSGV